MTSRLGHMIVPRYMETMEAVRLLDEKSGAKCILDCVKKVNAEPCFEAPAYLPMVQPAELRLFSRVRY